MAAPKTKRSKKRPTERAAAVKAALPAPRELERICKGLAALDAMMSDDWEGRYFSFNHAWNTKGKERMASMRNGSGDDWFVVFAPAGVFVKAYWHEYPDEPVAKIYDGLPAKLQAQVREPAFSMEHVTFGGWHDGTAWTLRGNAKPMREQLAILSGDPNAYRAYASDYFGIDVPVDAIVHVLAGKKIDAKLVARITTERTLADLKEDLAEVAY
ncbi:MAG: hypothetical protein ACKV2T_28975 [Kofleriaceae bacterium]